MIHVERVAGLVTLQDLGRPGWSHSGVSPSGAADRAACRRANRLVGNQESAAVLEVVIGGLSLRAEGHLVFAVTGAACPVRVDGRATATESVVDVSRGALLDLGTATSGLRAYVAVRGGIAVEPVLGSRSRDTLAGIGPEPVRAGDVLPVGPSRPPVVTGWPVVDVAPVAAPDDPEDVVGLRAVPGPRLPWFDAASAALLWSAEWEVTSDSDRVGMRLAGLELRRAAEYADRELPSEGLVRGAVQVPPSGLPVLFLADHPVTGGYPVALVVLDADVDRAAQVRPGRRVQFVRARGPRTARATDASTVHPTVA